MRSGSYDELSQDPTIVATYLGGVIGDERMTNLVAILVEAFVLGSIYALVAVGMTLVYGTLRILDMSQGSMVMVGSYVGWWILTEHGLPGIVALLVAFVFTFALGTATQLVSVQPLIGRRHEVDFEMITFITTFAVAIVLANVALQTLGPLHKNVPPMVGRQHRDLQRRDADVPALTMALTRSC